ncbi:MAG: RNA methyltransferase [Clostridiaceae bacterium]|nr:RNA methyltransferase [Clostridiaceae bacterium]
MISSTSNSQVKFVSALAKKAKLRKNEDLFVVEGIKMFSELPQEKVKKVYVSESFLKETAHKKLLDGISWECVKDDVFKAMSDTQTPQGVLALVKQFHYTMEDILKQEGPALIMILEAIQDPGNLGTIIRAGEGAGITGVIMSEGTADIYNPKTIRSTMGSVYRVPFVYADDMDRVFRQLKEKKIRLFAAHLKGRGNYEQEDYSGDTGFLIGNEANGLSDGAAAWADTLVKIPMAGQVESLNAAVASSVLMFEAARQRRMN